MKRLLLILLISNSILSFSQTLDPTFGTNGGIITRQVSTTPSQDYANAAVMQPDGKMIYAGGSYISRTTTLGSLDTSFNSYGFKKLTSGLEALVLQNDGKILVAGLNKIYRINTDGTLDTTFGTNGVTQVVLNGKNMSIRSIATKTNGQIIMAGYISNGTNNDFAVVSLNSNGSFNTFFDFDGISVLDISNSNDEAFALKIQNDSKIVLCGQSYDSTLGMYHFTTARFNSIGAVDTTYGASGYVVTMLPTSSTVSTIVESKARSIDIQSDGKIVISGYKKYSASPTTGYLSVVRYSTTGVLDATFGTGGIVLTTKLFYISNITTTTALTKPQIMVQVDGKILISCRSNPNLGVFKLESNGAFDITFGTGGAVTYNNTGTIIYSAFLLTNSNNEIVTGGTIVNTTTAVYSIQTIKFSNAGTFNSEQNFNLFQGVDFVSDIIEEAGGKIVVASSNKTLLKYNTNGSLDTTFGTNGSISVETYKLTKQQDGKLLYVDTNTYAGIKRLNIDGTVDTTFGVNGIVDFSPNTPVIVSYIDDITVASNGKIYLSFDYNSPNSPNPYTYFYYGILRLNNDGSLDTTFGTNGYTYVNFAHYAAEETEFPQQLYEQPDGKLVITGTIQSSTTNGVTGTARLLNNGQLDTSFGINGKIITNAGGTNEWGNYITKTAENKYLLNISSTNSNGIRTTALFKLNYDGSIDTSFGTNGILTDTNYYDINLQPDGKILRGGMSNSPFTVYRNNSDGSLDTSFGTNGMLSTPIFYYSYINKLAFLQNNKLLAAGYTYNGDSQILAFARYTNLILGELEFTSNENNYMVYPNPIEEQATFSYNLKEATDVTIELIDLQGKIIQTIVKNENQIAGQYQQAIHLPSIVSAGNYILRFSSPAGSQSIKIIKK